MDYDYDYYYRPAKDIQFEIDHDFEILKMPGVMCCMIVLNAIALFIQWFVFRFKRVAYTVGSITVFVFMPHIFFISQLVHPKFLIRIVEFSKEFYNNPEIYSYELPAVHPVFYVCPILGTCVHIFQVAFTKTEINGYFIYPEITIVGFKLAEILQNKVIQPVTKQLRDSDKRWDLAATLHGCRFYKLYNKFRSAHYAACCKIWSKHGHKPRPEFTVHDHLPEEMCKHEDVVRDWAKRQDLELYLKHPNFSHITSREHVFDRMETFHDHGLRNTYCATKQDFTSGITDAHIVETLMLKMLADHNFDQRYFFCESKRYSRLELFLDYYFGDKPRIYINKTMHGLDEYVEYEVITREGVMRTKSIFDAFALFFILRGEEGTLHEFSKDIYDGVKDTIRWQRM